MWFYEAFFGHFLMIKSHQRAQSFHPISPWYTYTYILSCSNPSLLSVLCGWIWLNLLLLNGHFRKPKLEAPWIRSMSGLCERIFSQAYGVRIREFPSIFTWLVVDLPLWKIMEFVSWELGVWHSQWKVIKLYPKPPRFQSPPVADHHHIPMVVGIIPY